METVSPKTKIGGCCRGTPWEGPPIDFVKINVDDSFPDATKSGGWGAICRDSYADVRFAAAGPLVSISDALHAEAMALSNEMPCKLRTVWSWKGYFRN
jgi:hypothetical protein